MVFLRCIHVKNVQACKAFLMKMTNTPSNFPTKKQLSSGETASFRKGSPKKQKNHHQVILCDLFGMLK